MGIPELLKAYKQTAFVVDTEHGNTVIRDGERNPEVESLLREHSATTGAFITAFNPRSVRLTDSENKKRHRRLVEYVEQQGFHYFTGRGVGGSGDWPAEESLFLVGITADSAKALGRDFGQVAIVFVETGTPAKVVEC